MRICVPFVWPVAIEVDAPARVRLVRARKRRLAILTPQAVLCLSVNESVRIDERDEIEIVVIEERAYQIVFTIPVNQLVRQVLDSHGRDPLASVSRAMPEDGLILAFAVLAPEVDALLRATFERFARDECFRIGEGIGKIV